MENDLCRPSVETGVSRNLRKRERGEEGGEKGREEERERERETGILCVLNFITTLQF